MASFIFDWLARRRLQYEKEEDTLKLLQASQPSPSTDPITVARVEASSGSNLESDQTKYASLPYIPPCCATIHSDTNSSSPPAPAYPITILRDIPYYTGPNSSIRHQLDIYFSPEAIRHHRASRVDVGHAGVPVTIHVHGGGWQRGDRVNEWRGSPNAGRSIARHGMIGVCPSYRLAPPSIGGLLIWSSLASLIMTGISAIFSSFVWDSFFIRWIQFMVLLIVIVGSLRMYLDRRDGAKVRHPENAIDICRAVKWVREHLHEHVAEADVDRIFLSGHSAGGHLVSLISTDPKYYRMVGLEDTSFIRGVCSVSGIYSLTSPIARHPGAWKNRLFRVTYGAAAFGYDPAVLLDASPITHASKSTPPFLLMSATSDMGLEVDAQVFDERLTELGVPHEYHIIQNTSHASIASQFEKHAAHQHLFRFIDKCCTDATFNTRSSSLASSSSSSSELLLAPTHVDSDDFVHITSPIESTPSTTVPTLTRSTGRTPTLSSSSSSKKKKLKSKAKQSTIA